MRAGNSHRQVTAEAYGRRAGRRPRASVGFFGPFSRSFESLPLRARKASWSMPVAASMTGH